MVTAFIFFLHLLFGLIVFTKIWQDENLKNAFLNLGLIALLFSVGWSVTGMITNIILEPEGFGIYLDRDAFSLLLLTIGEYFFYRIYYNNIFTAADKEKQ